MVDYIIVQTINHPLIKEGVVERRRYQIAIASTALLKNTLVVLPTGLGKTVIALLVIASRLLNESGKVLFLAPTKPLVEQHARFLRRTLKIDENKIVALSGEIDPEKRKKLWNTARIIVSTPQVVENDILANRINLEDVILAIFDEAHRAVGNYPYVFIAKEYRKQAKNPLILAMTASPGSDVERILEVVENLGIEEIEIRTEWDEDVRQYVHEKKIEWIKIEMPEELARVRKKLEELIKLRFKKLQRIGIEIPENISKKELLSFQEVLQAEASSDRPEIFEALSVIAEILKLQHAIELIETQGLEALKSYLKRLMKEANSRGGSKASKNIANDPIFREIVVETFKCKAEHPKIEKLKEVVKEQLKKNSDSRIIVFTNYRDSAEMIVDELSKEGIPVSRFVGQADRLDDRGMKQKEQIKTLERFERGEIKVLVATSVGEEGLDIPATDLVVFYEPVPSEIRAIQRKGRTGRGREGRIVVLITKDTRDEGYYYASLRKERIMYEKLYEIKEMLKKKGQRTLVDFTKPQTGVKIIVDSRELRSEVVKYLRDLGAFIESKSLEVADYILSDRVAVERKTTEDFLNSIIDKERLFSQILKLKSAYMRPILIIEGNNLYKRAIHPNAVRGAIASIAIDFGVPIIQTSDAKETAEFLIAIARREQEERDREIVEHVAKTKRTLRDEMEYVVSSISGVGGVTAKNLLKHFQTIERIATAKEEELMKVPKVGKKIASRIRKLMTTPYDLAHLHELEL